MVEPISFDDIEIKYRNQIVPIRVRKRIDSIKGEMIFSIYNDTVFKDLFGENGIPFNMIQPYSDFDYANELDKYTPEQQELLREVVSTIQKNNP